MTNDKEIFTKEDLVLEEYDKSLRPRRLVDYIGQSEIKDMLNVFITTAKRREESLDHVLLYGPPGLGKTTLANIIANEMGKKCHSASAPSINRIGDLVTLLTELDEGDILFIDEIHRLPQVVEEVLYSAMEDYCVDIIIGKDVTANPMKINLMPFTLIGATTRCGDISAPLRDRFGIVHQLNYYKIDELQEIVKRTSRIYDFMIDEESSYEIARRSRGTPRIANRLFKRVRDFTQYADENLKVIPLDITKSSLTKLDIDDQGLNKTDYRYLMALIQRFKGGPAGLNAIAASISEDPTTLEDVCEPYLLQEGFIVRTPRGRIVTEKTYVHLGIEK